MNKYIFSSLAIASVLASYPLAARGATILATATCGMPNLNLGTVTCTANIPPNPLPANQQIPWARITIPQYDSDDHGGAPLTGIDLNAEVGFSGIYRITNRSSNPLTYGDINDDVGVRALISGTGFSSPLNPLAMDSIGTGTINPPIPFQDFAVEGEDSKQTTVTPAQLGVYEGDGTVDFDAQLLRFFNVNADQDFSQEINANVYLNLIVTYRFTPPTPPTEIDEPNLGAFSILACVLGALFLGTRKNEP